MVLWDFDGTLASTSGDVWGSLAYAAAKRDRRFPFGFEDDDENLALPMSEIFASLLPAPDPADLAGFERDVRVHYRSISAHPRTELYPGIKSLLVELRACGVANRIVTNKPQGALERLLSIKGWAPLFDGWVCADSGPDGTELTKEQMIRIAIERQGADPARCAMVGDSWGDVAGARAAGIASIGVTYGDGSVERLLAENPDRVAEESTGLRELLLGD
ncbi:MAG: HAD family hydrolase [Collinsella phocaeensis]